MTLFFARSFYLHLCAWLFLCVSGLKNPSAYGTDKKTGGKQMVLIFKIDATKKLQFVHVFKKAPKMVTLTTREI